MTLYRFSKSLTDYAGDAASKEAKAFLGGKGAGLTLMSQKGLPVPPGFIIPCAASLEYLALSQVQRVVYMTDLLEQVAESLKWLKGEFGYMPLVSVRSGAPVSMPGMMDTILNVGLMDKELGAWAVRFGDDAKADRAVWDCQRRLIQMLSATGYSVPKEIFEFQLAKAKKAFGAKADTDLTASDLCKVVKDYLMAFRQHSGFEFPVNNAGEQIHAAIEAVFRSWNSPRAIEYRKLNGIPETMGTAVTVQAMVFGNVGDDSGSGVLFTRNPATGENFITGEYLANAQGEDVVAGIRTPKSLKAVSHDAIDAGKVPAWLGELGVHCDALETLYNDMVDVEFTVQKGELFILQSRTGKRTARAALIIALQMLDAGKINQGELFKRVTRAQYKVLSRPCIDPAFKQDADMTGIPACPGVAVGRPVFTWQDAVAATDPVILVTEETSPDDIAGMAKAVGILTRTGGSTSHAAVVARAMDKACVVGTLALNVKAMSHVKRVTIDGGTGRVWIETEVPVVDASESEEVLRLQQLAFNKLGVAEALTALEAHSQADAIVINLARWWNDYVALDIIMTNLVGMGTCENITLSMVPPSHYAHPHDEALSLCFGMPKGSTFLKDAVDLVVKNAKSLSGLTVVAMEGNKTSNKLEGKGIKVVRHLDDEADGVKSLPAEYAIFTALAG